MNGILLSDRILYYFLIPIHDWTWLAFVKITQALEQRASLMCIDYSSTDGLEISQEQKWACMKQPLFWEGKNKYFIFGGVVRLCVVLVDFTCSFIWCIELNGGAKISSQTIGWSDSRLTLQTLAHSAVVFLLQIFKMAQHCDYAFQPHSVILDFVRFTA